MWLILDTDVFNREELKEVDDQSQIVYLLLLLKAAQCPWWKEREDIVPCNKDILAGAVGCSAEEIKTALNILRKAGLVKLKKESELEEKPPGIPTFEEVQAAAKEIAPSIDAKKFYDYYAETGFMWKGQPVDWKAKLRGWQTTERPKTNNCRVASPEEMTRGWEAMYKRCGCSSMEEYLQYVLAKV